MIEKIKYPVRYDDEGQYIFDADGKMICEVRGWGWIHNLFANKDGSIRVDEAEKAQDEFGRAIAGAINDLQHKQAVVGVLGDLEEYMDQRADADGNSNGLQPNEEMNFLGNIREVLNNIQWQK